MESSARYEKDDIIINFRDLTIHMLRRWRSIIVGVLVITLLASALQYWKDQSAYKATLAAEQDKVSSVQLEGISLANANQVLQYQRLYQLQADYNRESLLMHIDPTSVPTRTLSYLVSGDKGYVAASLYQAHLGDLTVYKQIATQLTDKNDPSHIMELVTVTVQSNQADDALADHALILVEIIAPTEEIGAAISKHLKTQMQSLNTTVTAALGKHTLGLITESARLNANSALKAIQQTNLNDCNTLRNNLKSAKDALTAQERAYVEQMAAIDKVETDADAAKPVSPSISVKMLIAGFAAGLVLMLGLHALGYVFGRRLKSCEDFSERYGLFVFGCIADEQKKLSLTERLICRLFFKKEQTLSAQDRLALAQQKLTLTLRDALADKETARVCIIGCTGADAALAPFKEAAAKNGVALEIIPSPLTDAAALEHLNAADAVILAKAVGVSAYSDICRELELCERLAHPVLGAFILQ